MTPTLTPLFPCSLNYCFIDCKYREWFPAVAYSRWYQVVSLYLSQILKIALAVGKLFFLPCLLAFVESFARVRPYRGGKTLEVRSEKIKILLWRMGFSRFILGPASSTPKTCPKREGLLANVRPDLKPSIWRTRSSPALSVPSDSLNQLSDGQRSGHWAAHCAHAQTSHWTTTPRRHCN